MIWLSILPVIQAASEFPIEYIELLVTFLGGLLASSGFWLYLDKFRSKNDSRDKLIIGLAHDRIMYLGMQYLRKKYITQVEYENLHDYLYQPYIEMGGNGTATKMMAEIDKLPIRDTYSIERDKL